jgi:hypothetical protein
MEKVVVWTLDGGADEVGENFWGTRFSRLRENDVCSPSEPSFKVTTLAFVHCGICRFLVLLVLFLKSFDLSLFPVERISIFAARSSIFLEYIKSRSFFIIIFRSYIDFRCPYYT